MTAERAVLLAIQSAGRFDDEWESRVHQAVPVVAGLLREGSQAMRVASEVLDSAAIFGTFVKKELEESSQRLIVSFVADNNTGGEVETVRTHRIDEPAGAAMALRLVGLQEGDRCLFFKSVDSVTPTMKVRILAGFERLPPRSPRESTPPQRPREVGAERPARKAPPRAEAPAPNPNKPKVLRAALDAQTEEHKLIAIALLNEQGWHGIDDIPDDKFEKAMYIIERRKADYF